MDWTWYHKSHLILIFIAPYILKKVMIIAILYCVMLYSSIIVKHCIATKNDCNMLFGAKHRDIIFANLLPPIIEWSFCWAYHGRHNLDWTYDKFDKLIKGICFVNTITTEDILNVFLVPVSCLKLFHQYKVES